jgi:hypothetical protein
MGMALGVFSVGAEVVSIAPTRKFDADAPPFFMMY